jgi:hypothetical protein
MIPDKDEVGGSSPLRPTQVTGRRDLPVEEGLDVRDTHAAKWLPAEPWFEVEADTPKPKRSLPGIRRARAGGQA